MGTYNNQADYIAMIPGLINEAQMDIAISHKRLPAYKMLSELISQESAGWDVYANYFDVSCISLYNNDHCKKQFPPLCQVTGIILIF